MGGLGSGAPRQHACTNERLCIDVDRLTRDLQPGGWRSGTCSWSNGSTIGFTVQPGLRWSMSLKLDWRRPGDGQSFSQVIELLERRTPTRGAYLIAVCPLTAEYLRRLYSNRDASAWAGRNALGLKHRSTAESALDRARRRVRKVEARLEDRGCIRESAGRWRRPQHCRRDWFRRNIR